MTIEDRDLLYMLSDAVAALSKRLYPDQDIFIHRTGEVAAVEDDGDLPVGANIVFWGRRLGMAGICSA